MSKKLMLIAAGALTALAFTALPSVASAGEPVSTCGTATGVCNGTITGIGNAVLEDDSGSAGGRITCKKTTGTATATNKSSTGTASFVFNECSSAAGLVSCSSTGTAGEIKSGVLTTHLIYLHPILGGTTTDVGDLLTAVNVTITCGPVQKTVTGNVIGQITNPQCNAAAASNTVKFEKGAAVGSQKFTQITTTGAVFDLTSGSHASDGTTSSQIGEGTITWKAGELVTIDC